MGSTVEMLYQCATPPISEVIKILQAAKKKYGNIPVGSFNGEGVHIEVNHSDRPASELPIFVKRVKLKTEPPCCSRVYHKPNPRSLYVHFW
jgi:hypothetical protein